MRLVELVMVAVFAQGCARHALSAGGAEPSEECKAEAPCWSGTGAADDVVSFAVSGVLVGAVGVAVYRWLK